ncbi:hypothetical protein HS088_TW03G00977 [Tripterygium wilfordii]|uniref:Uncharacterized protein n=2 Tax=Tripterygium wilfordii TaxID=458696 RepID=A0A7J7DW88_TRIWF|nr:hypothetical protein HS088_TW03G00977 [Tripterygium wilfordii]
MSRSALVRHSRCVWRFINPRTSQEKRLLSFNFSTSEHHENQRPSRPAPPPIRVSLTESAGRGVFATRIIGAGDLIHTAKPIVSHPSLFCNESVCQFCLRRLSSSMDTKSQSVRFCSEECKDNFMAVFDVETRTDWLAFHEYCRTESLKYPLLVKRLACMVISGAAPDDCLDILQPAILSPEMVLKMEEGFGLLRTTFIKANIRDEQLA